MASDVLFCVPGYQVRVWCTYMYMQAKTHVHTNESLKGEMKSVHIPMNIVFKKKSQNFSVLLFILRI